ncbi:MAG: LysE family transporter [Treponema sp.]|nr:LysE family transporter [Treponema sp.]
MPATIIPSFLLYCFSCTITPGPANITSLAAALQYGKKAALQQWAGIITGFLIISLASVLLTYFLGTAFSRHVSKLSFVGAIYLIYLSVQMLRMNYSQVKDRDLAKPSFLSGFIIEMSNVKVVIFCMTCLSAYALPYRQDFLSLLAVGALLIFTAPMANLIWIFTGSLLQKFFARYQRTVNATMALALAACAASLIIGSFK